MTDFRSMILTTLLLSLSAPALALDSETADLVTSYTIEVPKSFRIDEDDGTVFVGIAGCNSMLANARVSVAFKTSFNPQSNPTVIEELDVFSVPRDSTARIDCITGDLCQKIDTDDYDLTATGVLVDIAFADILAAADVTDCEPFDLEFFIRLIVEASLTDSTATENADAKIVVDTTRPASPSGLTAAATENAIAVEFEASADPDINRYFVYWSSSPFDGGQDPASLTLERKTLGDKTSGSITVTLDPTKDVYVSVVAEDLAGNLSTLSGVVQATVVETNDFWEQYRRAGGAERGGCATTTADPSAWLLLIAVGLFGARRRRLAAALLVSTVVSVAPLAAGAESPTWGAFEIKFGGYYPAIDDEFGGSGPFESTFGGKNLLLGELEIDGWLWQGFGKVGVAGHIGYTHVKGGAVPSAETTGDELAIEDTTGFTIIPMRISAVYRFDWLAQNTRIPVSASIKVGPDFYRWRITNAAKETATFDGDGGSGWKRGWHLAAGLQLLLDFIDPSAAAAFDLSWGINNSYFFVEFMKTRVDNFGGEGFDLSDDIWMFGLSFEF